MAKTISNQNRPPITREQRDTSLRPLLRDKASCAIERALAALNGSDVDRVPTHRSCLTCQQFNEEMEFCNLHQDRPPPRVLVYSCVDYIDVLEVRPE